MSKEKSPELDTALHVLKGAVVKVLNTPLTVSAKGGNSKTEGRLVVEYIASSKPSDEQVKQIEELANKKIKENLIVETFLLDRLEAENKYKNNLVNNTYIYDKIPVPEKIQQLTVLHIPDWNVNCCGGKHVAKTGDIGGIKVQRVNHRKEPKNELEFVFELVSAIPTTLTNNNNIVNSGVVETRKSVSNLDDTSLATDKILGYVFEELKKQGITIEKGVEHSIYQNVVPQITQTITIVKNTSYTKGFTSNKIESKSSMAKQ